jgi:tetratricopeptide (TPR) repeat protein
MAHMEAGRTREALAEFQQALRLDRNYAPALVQMGNLLSTHQRFFVAYRLLQRAERVAPESAEVQALLGRCLFRFKKYNEAREGLRRALSLNPDLSEPHLLLAAIESRRGRLLDARQHIETFLRGARGTSAAQARRQLAHISFEMKDYEAALAIYAELLRADPSRMDVQTEVARTLVAAGRYEEAEHAFRAILERNPADQAALFGLFDSSYRRGASEQAIEAMEKLAKLQPQSCNPLINLVRIYLGLDQFRPAQVHAEQCLEIFPEHSVAHHMLGVISLREGDLLPAKRKLERALNSDPNLVEALYRLATVETQLGQTESALRLLEKAVSLDGEHEGARYTLGQVYARMDRTDEAEQQFAEFRRIQRHRAWDRETNDIERGNVLPAPPGEFSDTELLGEWIGLAKYLLKERKPRDALPILMQAQRVAPTDPQAKGLTAVAHSEAGDVDAALAAYAEAEMHNPAAQVFLDRGALYSRLGEDALALSDIQRALSMGLSALEEARARLLYALLLKQSEEFQDAEVELRRVLALNPADAIARVVLASTLLELGKPDEAAAECLRALEENSSDASARLLLALARIQQKQFADASQQIERAAHALGESGLILLARGKLAVAQGMRRLAIDYLTRAGQVDPSQFEVFYLLGNQLLKEGKWSEAALEFEKVTILEPNHDQSWIQLGQIYLDAGRAQEAVEYFRKAVDAAPDNAEAYYQLAIGLAQTRQFAQAEQAARHAQTLGHTAARVLLESLPSLPPR